MQSQCTSMLSKRFFSLQAITRAGAKAPIRQAHEISFRSQLLSQNPAFRYFACKLTSMMNIFILAQVIKVPKMGDSITEGTVQSFVKSK